MLARKNCLRVKNLVWVESFIRFSFSSVQEEVILQHLLPQAGICESHDTGTPASLYVASVLRQAEMISSSEIITAFCSEGATGIGTSRVQTRWGGASSS
jgi:hypothetical protein